MPSVEADPVLRLAHPDGPRFDFDGECVVFNPSSWEIHILNEAASAVYEWLAASPRSLLEIEALLADLLVADERSAAGDHARRVIQDLMSLGLLIDDGQAADVGR